MAIKPWIRLREHMIAEGHGKSFKAVDFLDAAGMPRTFSMYGQQNFAVILPLTNTGEVITIRQYYQGCNKVLRTLPGGNIEPSMSALKTIGQELLEETGYYCPEIIQWETKFG